VELYIHSPNTPSWRGAQLKEAQGQLYLYLYLYRDNFTFFDVIQSIPQVSDVCPLNVIKRIVLKQILEEKSCEM
jgi:hypothetical protein